MSWNRLKLSKKHSELTVDAEFDIELKEEELNSGKESIDFLDYYSKEVINTIYNTIFDVPYCLGCGNFHKEDEEKEKLMPKIKSVYYDEESIVDRLHKLTYIDLKKLKDFLKDGKDLDCNITPYLCLALLFSIETNNKKILVDKLVRIIVLENINKVMKEVKTETIKEEIQIAINLYGTISEECFFKILRRNGINTTIEKVQEIIEKDECINTFVQYKSGFFISKYQKSFRNIKKQEILEKDKREFYYPKDALEKQMIVEFGFDVEDERINQLTDIFMRYFNDPLELNAYFNTFIKFLALDAPLDIIYKFFKMSNMIFEKEEAPVINILLNVINTEVVRKAKNNGFTNSELIDKGKIENGEYIDYLLPIKTETMKVDGVKVGRNQPCPCRLR